MFLFRLASHLKKTVNELENELDYSELIEWIAFSKNEPLDGERMDYNSAGIIFTLHKIISGFSKQRFNLKLSDFIWKWWDKDKTKKKISSKEARQKLLLLEKAFGRNVKYVKEKKKNGVERRNN